MKQFYDNENQLCDGIFRTNCDDLSYLNDYKFKNYPYRCISLFSYLVQTITEYIDDRAFFDINGIREHDNVHICAHGFLYSFVSMAKVLSSVCYGEHLSVILKSGSEGAFVFSVSVNAKKEPIQLTSAMKFHHKLGEFCGFTVSQRYCENTLTLQYTLKKFKSDSSELCAEMPRTLNLWICAALADAEKMSIL